MSRTRTRNTLQTTAGNMSTVITTPSYAQYRYFPPNGQYYREAGTYPPYTIGTYVHQPSKVGQVATITDEVNSRGLFNAVTHVKDDYACPLQTITMTGSLAQGPGAAVTVVNTSAGEYAIAGINAAPFMATDTQMLAEASSRVRPQVVRPVYDVAQQVGEYLELARSVHSALERQEKYLASLKNADGSWKRALPKYLQKRRSTTWTLNEWAKLAVSSSLGYKFAIEPTIQAITDFGLAAVKIQDRMNAYMDSVQTLHGKSSRETTWTYGPYSSSYHSYTCFWSALKEVRATVTVKYRTPDSLANRLKLYSALYGAVPGIDTAWELTPLSFIVDFVADFGSVLRDWAHQPLDFIEYDVISSGWSKKITYTNDIALQCCNGTYRQAYRNVVPPNDVTGKFTRTEYFRESKTLDLTSFTPMPLNTRLPTAEQLVTVAQVAFAIKSVGFKLNRYVG